MDAMPLRIRPDPLPAPPPVNVDGRWALFLDVDGTLLDFAAHPAEVVVESQLRDDLATLWAKLDGAVGLLSGRPLAQLDDLFNWHERAAAGLHGAELRTPDGNVHAADDDAAFAATRQRAEALVAESHGVLLEDKQRALALHYRHAPAAGADAKSIADTLLREAGDGYSLQYGDHVVELKPVAANKGCALEALMCEAPFRGRNPWMLGDDLTDERAFERVNASHGISVIVGLRRPTAARFALADPAAVRGWLHTLASRSAIEIDRR
jgi:trehalose 6-phosphate phosphatase